MQEINFPIEILIHDDASTDGTEEIIRKYEETIDANMECINIDPNELTQLIALLCVEAIGHHYYI